MMNSVQKPNPKCNVTVSKPFRIDRVFLRLVVTKLTYFMFCYGFCTMNCRFSKVMCGIHIGIMNVFVFRFIHKLGM